MNGTDSNSVRGITGRVSYTVKRFKHCVKEFMYEEDGMGVVEIVLIIIVLVGLVVLFKSQITTMVNSLLSKMSSQASKI
ncbi:MAG: Flp1 family type IVb pilin [Lachnospira sp.]